MISGEELRTVVLPDGRQLSFAQWGAPGDPALIFMHGWPGSRLGGRLLASAARRANVRLIVPDRPGMGRSDPHPGRSLLDGARDTAALADRLGLDRFAVVGYSGGAGFALACAFLLPDRLSHVAVASGLGPLETRQVRRALPSHLRLTFSVVGSFPGFARLPATLISEGVRRFPGLVAFQACLLACAEDRRVLARPRVAETLRAEYEEAFRQGTAGVEAEAGLFARPWGFPLDSLPGGIHVYHGDADRFVPVEMGRHLARTLPDARFHLLAGAGHFWIVDRFVEALDRWAR